MVQTCAYNGAHLLRAGCYYRRREHWLDRSELTLTCRLCYGKYYSAEQYALRTEPRLARVHVCQ